MKKLTAFILAAFMLTISSCEKRSCVDVVCPGIYSICVDGQCYCQAGYEGEMCDVLSYLKYVGSYQVSESCTTTFGGSVPQQYNASISQGFRLDVITFSNFANRGLPVDASIISANYIAIESQNIGAVQISGGEGIYETFFNRLKLEYNYSAGGSFHSCTAIFTKF